MAKRIEEILPPVEILLKLEPEEIAVFLLDYLCDSDEEKRGHLNRSSFTSQDRFTFYTSDYNKQKEVAKVIMEAWMWLEKEGMIAPRPGESGEWRFVTRKGYKLRDKVNFETYKKANFLPKENLDVVLVKNVWPLFIRGDYDTAIFRAFKEIEVRIREKAKLSNDHYGLELITKALVSPKGLLTDKNAIPSEKEALHSLFRGSIGIFKNPTSHRIVKVEDLCEAAEIILFANYLLRIVDRLQLNNGP